MLDRNHVPTALIVKQKTSASPGALTVDLLGIRVKFIRGKTIYVLSTTMLPTSSKKTASKNLESIKFVGGSKFMKELQKTVFFSAYDSVVFLSGRSMTEKEQKELLRSSIIGSGAVDEMTLPEQMVLGLNQFSHLYDEVDIDINDDRNALSSSVSEGGVVDRHGGGSTVEGGEMISSQQRYVRQETEGLLLPPEKCWRKTGNLRKQARWNYEVPVDRKEFEQPS